MVMFQCPYHSKNWEVLENYYHEPQVGMGADHKVNSPKN